MVERCGFGSSKLSSYTSLIGIVIDHTAPAFDRYFVCGISWQNGPHVGSKAQKEGSTMLRFSVCSVLLLVATAGAAAEEKLLFARQDGTRGTVVELVDARTLATLGHTTLSSSWSRHIRNAVVTYDRRFALLVNDVPPLGTLIPSVAVVDITKNTLPVVARLGHKSVARQILITQDGRTAVVAGFVNQLGNPPPPELMFIDLKSAVPSLLSSWRIPGAQSAFGIALSAGDTHAYVVDSYANQVVVVDITKSPPVVATVLGVPGPKSIRVSPDGRRLLVPYNTGNYKNEKVAIWDLATPQAPTRLADLVLSGTFILDPPCFEPGSSFVVAETFLGNLNPYGTVFIADIRGTSPTILGSVGVGSKDQSTTGNLAVSSDGLSAWRAMGGNGVVTPVLEEIHLLSPTKPTKGRSLPTKDRVSAVASFGEIFTLGRTPLGTPFPVLLASPRDVGKGYALAAAFSTTPGIPLGSRTVPLSPDALFGASFSLPGIFQSFRGTLSATGRGFGVINVPNHTSLQRVSFYVAGVVLDPSAPQGVATVSNAVHIVLQ
jgi:hypothetical protein